MQECKQISMIVVSYNCKWDLEQCIKGYDRNSYRDDHQIIFVDNGSTDGSQEVIKNSRYAEDAILLDRNYGSPFAVNRAIGKIKHDWVGMYFSEDQVPGQHWDLEFSKVAEENAYHLIRYVIPWPDSTRHERHFGQSRFCHKWEFGNGPSNWDFDEYCEWSEEWVLKADIAPTWEMKEFGHAAFCHRKIVDELGHWKENPAPYLKGKVANDVGGEVEWCNRVKAAGYKSKIVNKSLFFHFTSRRPQRHAQVAREISRPDWIFPMGPYKTREEWYNDLYLAGEKIESLG